jgi:uncharacterized membrane protein
MQTGWQLLRESIVDAWHNRQLWWLIVMVPLVKIGYRFFFDNYVLPNIVDQTVMLLVFGTIIVISPFYFMATVVRLYQEPQLRVWTAISQVLLNLRLFIVAVFSALTVSPTFYMLRYLRLPGYFIDLSSILIYLCLVMFVPILVWYERNPITILVHNFQKIWQQLGLVLVGFIAWVGCFVLIVLFYRLMRTIAIRLGFVNQIFYDSPSQIASIVIGDIVVFLLSISIMIGTIFLVKVYNRAHQ